MKSRIYGVLIASLSAITFVLSAHETFAASGTSSNGRSVATYMVSPRLAARLFRHHHRPRAAFVWPGDDGFLSGPNSEPADAIQPNAGNTRYSSTSDIPWDWAHRYPPAVAPSERPYVSSCPSEAVTVPDGHGGKGEVNIVRCY